jgi:hypothetical protein
MEAVELMLFLGTGGRFVTHYFFCLGNEYSTNKTRENVIVKQKRCQKNTVIQKRAEALKNTKCRNSSVNTTYTANLMGMAVGGTYLYDV